MGLVSLVKTTYNFTNVLHERPVSRSRDILAKFGPYALKELEIASAGTRPNTCYGILIDKAKIEIVY